MNALLDWKVACLGPDVGFDVILADPPWRYSFSQSASRKVANQYPTLTVDEIAGLPVAKIVNPNAALFLWATNPKLREALHVLESWGFEYKTVAFNWVKTYRSGKPYNGMGYYTRSGSEVCLLGIRGRMERSSTSVLQVIQEVRGEHSAKPFEAYARIEELFGPCRRRAELFARIHRRGWYAWGNEVNTCAAVSQEDVATRRVHRQLEIAFAEGGGR